MLNTAIIILLPTADTLHSHKYQRERICFMALPHGSINRTYYQIELFPYRYGPCNETGQTQK